MFLCPWFPGHLLLPLLGGDSLQMHVNKFKCYKWILQPSVLVILTSWIQKCLWIWRIVFGGMISSPSFTYSLVSFSSAAHSMHSEPASQTFQKRTNYYCFSSSSFLYVCCSCSSSCCGAIVFCPRIVGISYVFNILCTFYILKSRILQFHRSNKSQAFKTDKMEATASQAQLQMRL